MKDLDALRDVSLRRWYPSRPEVVFRAFTERDLLERWFCPSAEVSLRVAEHDLRVGGRYRFVYAWTDTGAVVVGEFRAIEPPSRLCFTWTWEPPDPHAGEETLVTIELQAKDGGTELALTHTRFTHEELVTRHAEGWDGALTRLTALVIALEKE